jgi:hypothetical protein
MYVCIYIYIYIYEKYKKTKETAHGNGVSGSRKEGKLLASCGTVSFTNKVISRSVRQ